MQIHLEDPSVQAALISAIGALSVSVVAGGIAAYVNHKNARRRRDRERLITALADIAFLLAVEQAHCRHNRQATGRNLKMTMRSEAVAQGFTWSGRNTPGRAKQSGYTDVKSIDVSVSK